MPEYDDQYALEVARAQQGSGFIAAEVSPTGEVLSEAIDPGYLNAPSSDYRAAAALAQAITRRREEEARAEMRARQFKMQQDFTARVKMGEDPAMVLMEMAPMMVSPNQLASTYRSLREPEPKVDLTRMRAEQDMIRDELRQNTAEANTIQRSLNPTSLLDRALLEGQDKSAQSNRLNQLEGQIATGRSNYLQTASQPKAREGSLVRDRTNGKLYRIVNGQPVEQPATGRL